MFLHNPLPYTASTRHINNTLFGRLKETTVKNWRRFSRHSRKQRPPDIVNWRNIGSYSKNLPPHTKIADSEQSSVFRDRKEFGNITKSTCSLWKMRMSQL